MRYVGATTVYQPASFVDDFQYSSAYAGLSALDPRVAAGGIGPQGTIPGATIHAITPPVFNVPTTGLPAQSSGMYGTAIAAPALGQGSIRARGGPVTFTGRIRQAPLSGASGTPVSAGSGLVNNQLGSFPSARGGPVRPRNFIGHQIV